MMKNRLTAYLHFVLTFSIFGVGCEKVNDLHQKYLDEGPRIYVGKPDSAYAMSGLNQVRLVWKNSADPKISKTIIYYNFGRDSIIKPFSRKSDGPQWDSITLNMPPGDYLFSLRNFDASGELASIVVSNLMAKSYSDNFQSLLLGRVYSVSMAKDALTFNWDITPPYNSIYSVIRHYNSEGSLVKEVQAENEEWSSVLTDINVGDTVKVTTLFQPEAKFITPMESKPAVYTFAQASAPANRANFKQYIGIPYDNTTQHSAAYRFSYVFDNNFDSYWISSSPDVDPPLGANAQNNFQFPLSFTIDMASQIQPTDFEYRCMPGLPQAPRRLEVWGTNDIAQGKPNTYWSTTVPGVWQSDWIKLGSFYTSSTNSALFKFSVNPQNQKVRYLRVLVQELFNPIPGNIRVVIGEVNVYEHGLTYRLLP